MEEVTGNITIHLQGKFGNEPLTPGNYDISQLQELLGLMEGLVRPDQKKIENPVTLTIENGSVKNVFNTSREIAAKFAVILSMLTSSTSLNQFENSTAKGIEGLQRYAIKNNFDIDLSTSESTASFRITPQTTLQMDNDLWADAELYLYGKIVDAGGKKKSNIHIETDDGTFVVQTDREYLKNIKENPIYKTYAIRVLAKQNVITGEIDTSFMKLIDTVDYQSSFDKDYLESKIRDAVPVWKGVDADDFLHQLREGTYAG